MQQLLVFALRDPAGSWVHLARALRAEGVVQARVVTLEHDPQCGWPTDIAEVFDGGQELAHLVDHADGFCLVDLQPEEVTLFGGRVAARIERGDVRVAMQIDSTRNELRARALARTAAHRGWPLVCSRPGLAGTAGVETLAPFLPLTRAPWLPQPPGTRARARRHQAMVFASALGPLRDDAELEGWVDAAEALAASNPGVRVEVLCARAHGIVAARRRRASLSLVGGGLGRTALESLAQGVPVVTTMTPPEHAAWSLLAGAPPPVHEPASLPQLLAALHPAADPDLRLRAWALRAAAPQRWFDAVTRWMAPHAAHRAA
ncbi:MAG: hypothetical protein K1X88_21275 [Nannocystaceae bacterium]|nr:hypothetical protein [Nannocystaceae bacterium]